MRKFNKPLLALLIGSTLCSAAQAAAPGKPTIARATPSSLSSKSIRRPPLIIIW